MPSKSLPHKGLFEFVKMTFSLCSALATFQRVMQVVLAALEWICIVDLDDILIVKFLTICAKLDCV